MSFFLEGTVKIAIFNFGPVNRSTTQRPFWAAPRIRRKFGAAGGGGELRRANSFRPSIEMPKGGADQRPAEPKTKGTTFVVPFVLAPRTGVEPAAYRLGVRWQVFYVVFCAKYDIRQSLEFQGIAGVSVFGLHFL